MMHVHHNFGTTATLLSSRKIVGQALCLKLEEGSAHEAHHLSSNQRQHQFAMGHQRLDTQLTHAIHLTDSNAHTHCNQNAVLHSLALIISSHFYHILTIVGH